ncbi:hypothetical protein FB451DRAFT_1398240 [Mycena latifolia]|nr:hypothetical protein FB451DRAFT_1398240 [Mycena latifolia]
MDRSPSASPRALPFSLVEFGDLVSAALDSPDPLLSFNSSRLFSVGENPADGEQGSSRVRQMLKKFKKRAFAFGKRPSTCPPRPSSPVYRIPELRLSMSFQNVSCDDFVPYVPLVTQYERARARPNSPLRSTPSLPSHDHSSSHSLYTASNSSHSSFATAPTPSTSSCSSASASISSYPTTPLTTVSEEGFPARRWSACSSDSDLTPASHGADADAFGKRAVHDVPPSGTFPAAAARPLRCRARLPLAQPPPACPIPAPPLPLPFPAHTHPYRRAQPLLEPESPTPRPPTRRGGGGSLLDEFPAPPSYTPSPPRRCRTSAPPPVHCGAPWPDLAPARTPSRTPSFSSSPPPSSAGHSSAWTLL